MTRTMLLLAAGAMALSPTAIPPIRARATAV